MNFQEIDKLDKEIARQSSVARYAGHQYIVNSVWKYSGYIIVSIGFACLSLGFQAISVLIIGLVYEALATSHHNKSYKELQAEERALIELQVRRSALWVEVMRSKENE